MSTYAELLANILLVVPNPEKETLIKSKINQVIHFISTSGHFWRDIEETTIGAVEGVDSSTYVQSISISTTIRHMIYCKYPSTVEGSIACVNITELIDNCEILGDVAYLSGSILHIKNSLLASEFNIAYYTNPVPLVNDTDENWITQLVPALVEDLTTAYILNLIGEKEDAKRITDLASVFKRTYIRDFVMSVQ